jgi:hypothetical protein
MIYVNEKFENTDEWLQSHVFMSKMAFQCMADMGIANVARNQRKIRRTERK